MYRIYEVAKDSIFDNQGGKIPSPQTLIIALFDFTILVFLQQR